MFDCGEGFGGNSGESFAGARFVEMHGAAEEVIWMKAAEDEVGVGDGGAVSAAVAGGTGNGSGGLRTDLQSAGRVHPRERAAACARRVDIEHGNANGETGDLAFGAGGWLASGVEESDVVEVPPMSKVRMRSMPAARATLSAPITPPAGPERMVVRVHARQMRRRGFRRRIA